MRLTFCPERRCGVPAEIVRSAVMSSTEGPVEVVTIHCARRHVFTLPAEALSDDVFVAPVPAR